MRGQLNRRRQMCARFASGTAAFLVVWLALATLAQPTIRQTIPRRLPSAASEARAVGRLADSTQLTLAIGLPLRNQAGLQAVLQQLYDPGSTNYHRYLTPAQFTEKFGPDEHDYKAVEAFATANGLGVAREHSNRMLVEVTGSAANIERAFHTTLRTYQHPTEQRTFYAADTDPSLDLTVPILSIDGLNNYSLPHAQHREIPLGSTQNPVPNAGSGPGGTYAGYDFRAAYAPDTTLTGTGQTLGLLQFDGYYSNDIAYYESNQGLPSVTLSNILLNGATGTPNGNELEVSLDIEMAVSMAPGLNRVLIYEAPPSTPYSVILNQMATDDLANQLSSSWILLGSPSNALCDQIFEQMIAQGQSFFNASGDGDAYTGLIDFPCDSPYITQVGGTSLTTTNPTGPWVSETVWNNGSGHGSGGGISTQYAIPAWQTNINMTTNQGSTTMRNVPDVAMVAQGIYVRVDGSDTSSDGTSAGAPLWAAYTALINEQAAAIGKPPVGFLNPMLSLLGTSSFSNSVFHDITNGNNTSATSPGNFYAVPGYDLCTGWGTPFGASLMNALTLVTVTLPASATEGDGVLTNAGLVQLTNVTSTNITVSLTSSITNKLMVPPTVTLLAGHNSVAFNLTIVDNAILDGTQYPVVVATVPGYGLGVATMAVYDNETATLGVSLPATVFENQGTVTGTVYSSAAPGANVSVTLSSNNTNQIQVPPSVELPDGQTSAVFTATLVNDNQLDGPQQATITAHVQNWTDGTATIYVLNIPPSDPRPANLATSVPANTNLSWSDGPGGEFIQNGGFETGTFTNWSKENTAGGDFAINDGSYTPPGPDGTTPPFAGNYSVVSEQSANGKHVLYQDITVPTGVTSAILSWEDRIRNYATQFTSNQYFDVEIRNTNDALLQVAFTTQPGDTLLNDWTNRSFNLAPYAGQRIRIAFVEADSLYYFNVHLDNISVQITTTAAGVSNDVYFGTNPTPGPAQFQGNTTNTSWPLPLLQPQTTYYWQIVTRKGWTNAGPVWQFTTAGVDHFGWNVIPSPQLIYTPFAVTVTALDSFNRVVTNFTNPVMFSSIPPGTITPGISDDFTNGVWNGSLTLEDRATNLVLIADDGNGHTGDSDAFNVGTTNLPVVILTQPSDQSAETAGTVVFSVQADGTPNLYYQWYFANTTAIPGATNSSLTLTNVQSTNAGNYSVTVSNVFGSMTSSNAMLTVIPLDHFSWDQISSPRFVNAAFAVTIRAEDDENNAFTNFIGTVALSCSNAVPIRPTVSGTFSQGVWTGMVTISQVASNLSIVANDGAGHTGVSYPIDVVAVPRLGISNSAGSLIISWPTAPSNFNLEYSGSLAPGVWMPVGGSPILTNGLYVQSIPLTNTVQFYRLQYSGP